MAKTRKKYRLLSESKVVNGRTVYRIQAIRSFGDVRKGDLGGFVESYCNLSNEGNSWVYDDAVVLDSARVTCNSKVYGQSLLQDCAFASGNSEISDNVVLKDSAHMTGNAHAYDNATLNDDTTMSDDSMIQGNASIHGTTILGGYTLVGDKVKIIDCHFKGGQTIKGDLTITEETQVFTFYDNWYSQRHFTYTVPNKMWTSDDKDFSGTGEEFIEHFTTYYSKFAGKMISAYVKFVKELEKIVEEENNDQ